jgi:hypothetical protein
MASMIQDDTKSPNSATSPTSPDSTKPIMDGEKHRGANTDAPIIKYQKFYSEWFLFLCFMILLVFWIIGGIIVQVASSTGGNFWNPECQKACNQQEGFALRAFIVLVAILEIPYLLLCIYMRKMDDEFSIRNELFFCIIFSSLMMIGMIILVIVPGAFWPQQSYIGYLLGVTLIGTFVVSVVYPLVNTWFPGGVFNAIWRLIKRQKGEEKEDAETPVEMTGADEKKGPTVNQIEYFLTVNEGKEHFKQFLVREFSVENLMFYTEVQYYKKIDDENDLKETAKTIHETYVELGAPFEINIDNGIRTQVAEALSSGKPTTTTFDAAEQAVLTVMREESFPRFKKSRLYQQFVDQQNKQ